MEYSRKAAVMTLDMVQLYRPAWRRMTGSMSENNGTARKIYRRSVEECGFIGVKSW